MVNLANAFHSIRLHASCWYKFAFTFRGQQYAFKCTPQGFHSSPRICNAHIMQMWDRLQPVSQSHRISYIDGVLIHGETEEQVREITPEVLGLIQDTRFKASREKSS